MAITGIYTKDFPDLGRDANEADLIPIAEVGNIVTKKTPVSGLITSARVVGALGFTPYNSTNPAGYISGITSGMVTTALGFTPYNATNPAGYTSNLGTVTSVSGTGTVSGITLSGTVTTSGSLTLGGTLSLTSSQVTSALGYTPYDATNPAGYITSAALSGYVTLDTAQTITGAKTLTSLLTGTRANFTSSGSDNTFAINHSSGSGIGLSITKGGNGEGLYVNKTSGSGNAATIIGTLNATTLVKNGGTSSQFLKADGSVDSNSYALVSQLHNPVTIGTANGLSLSGQALSMALASGSVTGALSSANWTTFNNKQNALNGTGFVKISGTTISYDNSSYALASSISGTTNYLAKFTASGTVGNSLIFDNGTNVGIGTTSPESGWKFDVAGIVTMGSTAGNGRLYISTDGTTNGNTYIQARNLTVPTPLHFFSSVNYFQANVGIGTTTDAGYKLDVNGTGRFSGQLRVDNNSSSGVVGTNFIAYAVSSNSFFRLGNNSNNSLNIQLTRSDSATMFSVDGHTGASTFAGAATFSSTVTSTGFFVSSDITLKTLTQDTFDASKIDAISYKWKTDLQGKTLVGYSAQDVQKYMPDAVNTDSNGKLSVDYIQVLVQKIAHLENKLKEHGLE